MCWALCYLGLENTEAKKTDVTPGPTEHRITKLWILGVILDSTTHSLSLSSHPTANPSRNAA